LTWLCALHRFLSDVELLHIIGKLHPSERYYAKQQADYILSQVFSWLQIAFMSWCIDVCLLAVLPSYFFNSNMTMELIFWTWKLCCWTLYEIYCSQIRTKMDSYHWQRWLRTHTYFTVLFSVMKIMRTTYMMSSVNFGEVSSRAATLPSLVF
jgi:hypothetical protein